MRRTLQEGPKVCCGLARGAAGSRTLQEGPNVICGLAVSPGTAGPTLRGAARGRTLQEGPNYVLRVGGEPRKTTTVNGTVPLKPLYKGQVGCARGTAQMNPTALAMPSRSLLTT